LGIIKALLPIERVEREVRFPIFADYPGGEIGVSRKKGRGDDVGGGFQVGGQGRRDSSEISIVGSP
jgi:hypothetical protein